MILLLVILGAARKYTKSSLLGLLPLILSWFLIFNAYTQIKQCSQSPRPLLARATVT